MKKIILFLYLTFFSMSATYSIDNKINILQIVQNTEVVFDENFAVQKYLSGLSPEEKEKSDSYFEEGYWLMIIGLIVEIIIAWILLSLGLSK